jgi:ribonuclease G
VNIKTREEDPNNGNKEVEAPIIIIDHIKADIERIIDKKLKVTLHVHPFIAAYLKQGFPSLRVKWFIEHKKWIKIIPRDAFTYLHYKFTDDAGKKIRV